MIIHPTLTGPTCVSLIPPVHLASFFSHIASQSLSLNRPFSTAGTVRHVPGIRKIRGAFQPNNYPGKKRSLHPNVPRKSPWKGGGSFQII